MRRKNEPGTPAVPVGERPERATQRRPIVQTESCTIRCPEGAVAEAGWTVGQSYQYEWRGTQQITIKETTDQSNQIDLSATVAIDVLSACKRQLRVLSVAASTRSGASGTPNALPAAWTADVADATSGATVQFASVGGRVTQVCAARSASTDELNIKRAVISALQLNALVFPNRRLENLEEESVFGRCRPTYTLVEGNLVGTGRVRRELSGSTCTDHATRVNSLRGVRYSTPSYLAIDEVPLLNSTQSCSIETQDARVKSLNCSERHLFKPFTNAARVNGAVATGTASLRFVSNAASTVAATANIANARQTNLMFEADSEQSAPSDVKFNAAKTLLENECTARSTGLKVDSPENFAKLVLLLRDLTKAKLRELLVASRNCGGITKASTIIEDALSLVQTEASVGLIAEELLSRGESINWKVRLMWNLGLYRTRRPTVGMVAALEPLLSSSGSYKPDQRSALVVAAVLHEHCVAEASRDKLCTSSNVTRSVLKKIAMPISMECGVMTTPADHPQMMLDALRSLGNAGFLDETTLTLLKKCVVNTQREMLPDHTPPTLHMRVSAVQAYRRVPCEVDRSHLRTVFNDSRQDAELRVASYLELMRCADESVVRFVRRVLATERTKQVGSFVVSHLKSLSRTEDLHLQDVRNLVESENWGTAFERFEDLQPTQFSRNFETSNYLPEYNLGDRVDANVIYSSQSFVPRSLGANLTINWFGRSVNLLEVGLRAQNLEEYFSELLNLGLSAPGKEPPQQRATSKKRFPHSSALAKVFKLGPDPNVDWKPRSEFQSERSRSRRSVRTPPKQFDRQKIKTIDQTSKTQRKQATEDPSLHVFARVFGNELMYRDALSLIGQQAPTAAESANEKALVEEVLQKLATGEGVQGTLGGDSHLVHTTVVLATALGLPLRLQLDGVLATQVTYGAKVDMSSTLNIDSNPVAGPALELTFKPSAALQVSGRMQLGVGATFVGIRLRGTLHTNSGFKLKAATAKSEETVGVKLTYEIQPQTTDVLNIETRLYVENGDEAVELSQSKNSMVHRETAKVCTPLGVTSAFGIKQCLEYSYWNGSECPMTPAFPLTGPFKLAITTAKLDAAMTGYELFVYRTTKENDYKLYLSFSRPGSASTNHEASASLSVLREDDLRTINLQLNGLGGSRIVKLELANVPGNRKFALSYSGGQKDYGAVLRFTVNRETELKTVDFLASIGRKEEGGEGERLHNYLYFQKVYIAGSDSGSLQYLAGASLPNILQNFEIKADSTREASSSVYKFPVVIKADKPQFQQEVQLEVDCPVDDSGAWQWDQLNRFALDASVPNSWLARLPGTSFANNQNLRTINLELTRPTDVNEDLNEAAVEVIYKTREKSADRDDFYMGSRLKVANWLSFPLTINHTVWFDASKQLYATSIKFDREVTDEEDGQQRKGDLELLHHDPVRNMEVKLEGDYVLKAGEQRLRLELRQKLANTVEKPWHLLAKNQVKRVAGDFSSLCSTLEFGRDDQVISVSHSLERDPPPGETDPDVEQDVRWDLRAKQYTDWIEIEVPSATPRKYNITTAIRIGPHGFAERSYHLFSSILGGSSTGSEAKRPLYALRFLFAPSRVQPTLHIDVRRKPLIAPRLDDELSQLPQDTDSEMLYLAHFERAYPSRKDFGAEEGAAGLSLGLILDKKFSFGISKFVRFQCANAANGHRRGRLTVTSNTLWNVTALNFSRGLLVSLLDPPSSWYTMIAADLQYSPTAEIPSVVGTFDESAKSQLLAYTTQFELTGRYGRVRNTHRLLGRYVDSSAVGANSVLFVDLRSAQQFFEGGEQLRLGTNPVRVRSNSSFVYKREHSTFSLDSVLYVAGDVEGTTAATLTPIEPEQRDRQARPEIFKVALAGVYVPDRAAGAGRKSATVTTHGTLDLPLTSPRWAFAVNSTLHYEAQSDNLRNQVRMRPSKSSVVTTFTGLAVSAYPSQTFTWTAGHEINPSRYYSAHSRLVDGSNKKLVERGINITLEESRTHVETLHYLHVAPFDLFAGFRDCSIRTNYTSNVPLAAALSDWKALLNAKRQFAVEARALDTRGEQYTMTYSLDQTAAYSKPAADGSGQHQLKLAWLEKATLRKNTKEVFVAAGWNLEFAQNSGLLANYSSRMDYPADNTSEALNLILKAQYRVEDDSGPAGIRLLPALNKQVVCDYELSIKGSKSWGRPLVDINGNVTINRRGITQLGSVAVDRAVSFKSKRYLTLDADPQDAELRAFRVGQELTSLNGNPNASIANTFSVRYKHAQIASLALPGAGGAGGLGGVLQAGYLFVNAIKRVQLACAVTGAELTYVNSRPPYSLRGELSLDLRAGGQRVLRAVHKFEAVSASRSVLELGVQVLPDSRASFVVLLTKSFDWLDAIAVPQPLSRVLGDTLYQYTSNGSLVITPLAGQTKFLAFSVFKPKNGELRKTMTDEAGNFVQKLSATYAPTAADANKYAFELKFDSKQGAEQKVLATANGTWVSIADVDATFEMQMPAAGVYKASHRHRLAWPEELAYRGSAELHGQSHLLSVQYLYTAQTNRNGFEFEFYCPFSTAQYYKLSLAKAPVATTPTATSITAKLITAADARATNAQSRLDATLRYDTAARTADLELKDVLAQPLRTTVSQVSGGYSGQVQYGGANVGQATVRYPLAAGGATFEVTASANLPADVATCSRPSLTTAVKYDKEGDAGRKLTLQFDQQCAGASSVKFDGLVSGADAWNTDLRADLSLGFTGARAKRLAFGVKRASATKQALDQSISTSFDIELTNGTSFKSTAEVVFKWLPQDYRFKLAYSVPPDMNMRLPKTLLLERSFKAIADGFNASAAFKADSMLDLKWKLIRQEPSAGPLALNFDGSLGVNVPRAIENANAKVKFTYTKSASDRKLDASVGAKFSGQDVLACNDIKYERRVGEWPTMSATIELPWGKHVWTTSTEGGATFKAELDVENAPPTSVVKLYPKNIRLSIKKADWESTLVVAYSAEDSVVHTINAKSNLLALFLLRDANGEFPTIKSSVVFPQRVLVRYGIKSLDSEFTLIKRNLVAPLAPASLQAKLFARRALFKLKVESHSVRTYELTHTSHVYAGALVKLASVNSIAEFRAWVRGLLRQTFYLESSTTMRIDGVDHSGSLLASRNEDGEVPESEQWPIRSVRHHLAIDSNSVQNWLSEFRFKRVPASDSAPKQLLVEAALAPSGESSKIDARYGLEMGNTSAGQVFNVNAELGVGAELRASYWRKRLVSETNKTLALNARLQKPGSRPAQLFYKRSIIVDGSEYLRTREFRVDLAEGTAQRQFRFHSERAYCVRDEHPRTLKWSLLTPFRNASYEHKAHMYQEAEHKSIYAFPLKTFEAAFKWQTLHPQVGAWHSIGATFTQVKDPATHKWTGNLSATSSLLRAPISVHIEKTGSWLQQVQTTSVVTFGLKPDKANVSLDWSYYQNRVSSRFHLTHQASDSNIEVRYSRERYLKRRGLKFEGSIVSTSATSAAKNKLYYAMLNFHPGLLDLQLEYPENVVQFKSERSYSVMPTHHALLRLNDMSCRLDSSMNPYDRSFKSELLIHTLQGQQVPDRVTLSGGFDTQRSYAIQLTARVDQSDVNPLSFNVRRDGARKFNVRSRWQGAQFQTIVDRLAKSYKVNGLFGLLYNSLESSAIRPIFTRCYVVLSPLLESMDMGTIGQEFVALARTPEWYGAIISDMYQKNDLFMKSLCQIGQQVFNYVVFFVAYGVIPTLEKIALAAFEITGFIAQNIVLPVIQKLGFFFRQLESLISDSLNSGGLGLRLAKLMEFVSTFIGRLSTGLKESLENLKVKDLIQSLSSGRVSGYFNSVVGAACRAVAKCYNDCFVPLLDVFSRPLIALLRARSEAFAAADFRLSSRLARMRTFVVAFFDALKKYVDERNLDLRFYNGTEAGQKFDEIKAALFSDDDITNHDKFITDRVQKLKWASRYWGLSNYTERFTWNVSDAAVNATIGEATFDVKTLRQDPVTGEEEVEVTLPLTLPSVHRVPGFKAAERVARVVGWLRYLRERASGDTALKLMSRYRGLLARFSKGVRDEEERDPVRVKPAAPAIVGSAYALLAGKRHVVTFDNVPYDFDGGCRYILSRYRHDPEEEEDNELDFTVAVDYAVDSAQPASRSVASGRSISIGVGSKTVTLQSNLVVQLDHADVALPLVLEDENLKVERRGSHVEASLLNGAFVVKCYAPHQVCEFVASRHLHGKLVGLLGNMNGEAEDDGLTPSGEEVSNPADFAKAWHVESGCTLEAKSSSADDSSVELPANSTGLAVCNEAFESGRSPLAACFGSVEVDRYASNCVRDVELEGAKQPATERRVACAVAAMYLHECQLQHVPGVALPASCSRCELELEGTSYSIPTGRDLLAHSLGFDMSRVDVGPAGSLLDTKEMLRASGADVVFVVEEDAGCVENFATALDGLVDALQSALTSNRSVDNRYALVGASRFGGSKGQQHVHVGRAGAEFVNAAELKQLLGQIHVPTKLPKDRAEARWLTAPSSKGLFNALRQALSLFSRPSAVRQLVLVRCSTCSWSAQEADDLRDLLKRADVKLHVVTPFASTNASTPFGYDLSLRAPAAEWGARSPTMFASITGSISASDTCLSLVSGERGLVVNLRRINASAFANAIVRRAAEEGSSRVCRKCQCLADTEEGGSGLVLHCNACAERSAFFRQM